MAYLKIETSIKIQATPEKVWNILTDFEKYAEWNPFILSLEGDISEGNTIAAKIDGMQFKPQILSNKKNEELKWLGKLFFKGLFDGEHHFIIEDHKDGTVTFHQNEIFNGLLVGLFSKKLKTETKDGFIAMNEKLKELAEA